MGDRGGVEGAVDARGGDRRRRLDPDQRRVQLLGAGVAALAEVPLHDLTIDEVARRAEVSRGLVFHYFGSRAGMHRALVVAARDGMLRATEPTADLPAAARLRDTLERTVAFVRGHRGTFYSLVRGVSSGDSEVRAAIDEARAVQAARVLAVAVELGGRDTALLRMAVRAWIGLAEEALVEAARDRTVDDVALAGFLTRSALAVAEAAEPDEAETQTSIAPPRSAR